MYLQSSLRADQRVHSAGRDDLAAYAHQIATSTEARHGPAIEAMVRVALEAYQRLHRTYVRHLSLGRPPGRQVRSGRWREASEAWSTAQEMLAAGFAHIYPKHDRPLPLAEVEMLMRYRLGALCTGWHNEEGELVHHPDQPCEQHNVPGQR